MAIFTVYTIPESAVSVVSGIDGSTLQLSGLNQGDGSHLSDASAEITISSNSWVSVQITESSSGDVAFGDSDSSQSLTNAITYDGTAYAAGLRVESEYELLVEDSEGNQYTIVAFNINEPGAANTFGTVEGLAFVGDVPPLDETLTVIESYEGPNDRYASFTSPPCFTTGVLISTPAGKRPVETLKVGDLCNTLDDGAQPIRWVGKRHFTQAELAANPKLLPVRITAGALGNGMPERDLVVSRQHRILVSSKIAARLFGIADVLIPAIKLTQLLGIFVDDSVSEVTYFHILLDTHSVIWSENAPTESLFTGPEALKSLSEEGQDEVLAIFPELLEGSYTPEPARHMPTQARAVKQLVSRHKKNKQPVLNLKNAALKQV